MPLWSALTKAFGHSVYRKQTRRKTKLHLIDCLEPRILLSALTSGVTVNASISTLGDVDEYSFVVNEGDSVAFSFAAYNQSAGNFSAWLRILGPQDNEVYPFTSGHTSDDHSFTLDDLPAGLYTVTVQDADGTYGADYSLTYVRTPGSHTVEPGEGALTSGVTKEGHLGPGDIDVYTFNAEAGDSVAFSFAAYNQSAGNFAAWLRVVDPNGDELYPFSPGHNSDDHSFTLDNLAAGLYTVTIQDSDGSYSADYSLTYVKTPGTHTVEAGEGPLTSGVTKNGHLDPGDINVYTFNADAGDSVAFSFAAYNQSAGNFAAWLRVVDPNGDELYPFSPGHNSDDHSFTLDDLVAGLYTVTIQDSDGSYSADYSLTYAKTPGTHTFEAGEGPLTSGVTNSGHLAPGDIDVFTFNADAGDSVAFSFAAYHESAGNFNAWLRVVDPNGDELYPFSPGHNSDDHSFTLDDLVAGLYTVTIQDSDGSFSADYSLTYVKTPGDQVVEIGEGALTDGVQTNGHLDAGDINVYQFHANEDDTVNVEFETLVQPLSNFSAWLRVIAPDGEVIYPSTGGASSDDHSFTLNDLPAGVYTITVQDSNGSYAADYALTVTGFTGGQPPVVDLPGPDVQVTEGDPAVLIDNQATVFDADSSNFNGGTLTAALVANAQAGDLLSIRTVGTGNGQVNTSGNEVRVGTIVIGTFSGGVGTDPLVVELNSNATTGRVQALLRNLLYSHTSEGPTPAAKTLAVTLTDGVVETNVAAGKTIQVTPLNDRPLGINLSSTSVPYNWPVGTVVGTLDADDPDVGDVWTYELVDGAGDDDNHRFEIVGNELRTMEVFPYGSTSHHKVRIRVTDSGGTRFESVFNLTVVNANNRPAGITISSRSIVENQPIGTVVGTLTAVDSDPGDSFTYELVSGAGDDDNARFTIVGNALQTAEILNYDADSELKIRVRVTDAAGTRFEAVFNINVLKENHRPTDLTLNPSSVTENSSVGTTVGVFTAVDQDVDDTFTYELVSGSGDDDNARFTIVGDQLKTAEEFNFEADNLHKIRVRVTDAAGTRIERVFNISVLDRNERPTGISLSSKTVLRNQPVGTVVGDLSATDADAGDSFTFELVSGAGSTDNANFAIDGDQLVTNGVFDNGTKTTSSVRVRVTDAAGTRFEAIFKIKLVNTRPTGIELSSQTVAEDAPVDTLVGVLSAIDPDAGDSFNFSLVSGSGDDDNAAFTIDGNELRTATTFNQELQDTYSIRIRVTDAVGTKFEAIFQISITSES